MEKTTLASFQVPSSPLLYTYWACTMTNIFFMKTIGNQGGIYNVQSSNRIMTKLMFHRIYLPILLLLLTSQTVIQATTSSFSEMISNIMALSNTELVVISDYNSEIKVMMKLNY